MDVHAADQVCTITQRRLAPYLARSHTVIHATHLQFCHHILFRSCRPFFWNCSACGLHVSRCIGTLSYPHRPQTIP